MKRLFALVVLMCMALFSRASDARGPHGTLVVSNDRGETVVVSADSQLLGSIVPRATERWTLRPGRYEVIVRNTRGTVLSRSYEVVRPGRTSQVRIEGIAGHLRLSSEVAVPLTISLDRQVLRLAPGQSLDRELEPGTYALRATYEQYGKSRTLLSRTVHIGPRDHERITLRTPDFALLKVENRGNGDGVLYVDGRQEVSIPAGASREVRVSPGYVRLDLRVAGHIVDQTGLRISPLQERTFAADYALTGELLVRNPLPVPVTLTCARGLERTVPAHGSTRYDRVGIGVYPLSVRLADGRKLDSLRPRIEAFATTHVEVERPRTGLVELRAPRDGALTVHVDGRRIGTFHGDRHHIEISVGRHHLELRSERGRVVHSEMLFVDAFQVTRVEVRGHGYDGRDSRAGRDDRWGRNDDRRSHDGHVHDASYTSGDSCTL